MNKVLLARHYSVQKGQPARPPRLGIVRRGYSPGDEVRRVVWSKLAGPQVDRAVLCIQEPQVLIESGAGDCHVLVALGLLKHFADAVR